MNCHFGISSAPEIFQRQINDILSGLVGVLCHVDDILVFGKDTEEHKTRLYIQAVFSKLQAAGEKLQLIKIHVSFPVN